MTKILVWKCFDDVEFDKTTMCLLLLSYCIKFHNINDVTKILWLAVLRMWNLRKRPCPFTFGLQHQIKQCQWFDRHTFVEFFLQCELWSNNHVPLLLSFGIKLNNVNDVTKIFFTKCFDNVEFDQMTMALYIWVTQSNSITATMWPKYYLLLKCFDNVEFDQTTLKSASPNNFF